MIHTSVSKQPASFPPHNDTFTSKIINSNLISASEMQVRQEKQCTAFSFFSLSFFKHIIYKRKGKIHSEYYNFQFKKWQPKVKNFITVLHSSVDNRLSAPPPPSWIGGAPPMLLPDLTLFTGGKPPATLPRRVRTHWYATAHYTYER
jgi:hypothetical protein